MSKCDEWVRGRLCDRAGGSCSRETEYKESSDDQRDTAITVPFHESVILHIESLVVLVVEKVREGSRRLLRVEIES